MNSLISIVWSTASLPLCHSYSLSYDTRDPALVLGRASLAWSCPEPTPSTCFSSPTSIALSSQLWLWPTPGPHPSPYYWIMKPSDHARQRGNMALGDSCFPDSTQCLTTDELLYKFQLYTYFVSVTYLLRISNWGHILIVKGFQATN